MSKADPAAEQAASLAALQRGAAGMPATLGEGCTRRFDPEQLSEAHGTEFPSSLLKFAAMITPTASGSSGRARLLPV